MWRTVSITFLIAILVVVLGCGGASHSTSKVGPSPGPPSSPSTPASVISITPSSETIRIGGQRVFSGWDTTVGQYDVTWSLQEGATGGSVTADGLYTAPSNTGTFHLVATSIANPSNSATAVVKVVSVGFVRTSDMAIARTGHTATLLTDGRVLIAGGTVDSAHDSELFDSASSTFTAAASGMVHPRIGHCSSILANGKVLIAGGAGANGNLFKTAEVFDPATQKFSATGDLNQARSGATATLLPSGKVLIAGGDDSTNTSLPSAELYDPGTGTFLLSGKMQSPRAHHTATLLPSGKVLLVGSDHDTSSAELFDPVTGHFTATGSLGQARTHHTATLLQNGKVLVLGGTQTMPPGGGGAPAAPVSLDSGEIYDPAAGVFKSAGKLIVARDSHTATLLANGMVLVAGGYSHGFDGDADPEWVTMFVAEVFNPATSASTAAASLEGDRAEHVATLLSNGQVLVTGGVTGFQELCCRPKPVIGILASSEVYK